MLEREEVVRVAWSSVEAEWLYGDALQDSTEKCTSFTVQVRRPSLDDYDEGRSGPFAYADDRDLKWYEQFFPDNNE